MRDYEWVPRLVGIQPLFWFYALRLGRNGLCHKYGFLIVVTFPLETRFVPLPEANTASAFLSRRWNRKSRK